MPQLLSFPFFSIYVGDKSPDYDTSIKVRVMVNTDKIVVTTIPSAMGLESLPYCSQSIAEKFPTGRAAIRITTALINRSGSTGRRASASSMGRAINRIKTKISSRLFHSTSFTFIPAREIPITIIDKRVQALP